MRYVGVAGGKWFLAINLFCWFINITKSLWKMHHGSSSIHTFICFHSNLVKLQKGNVKFVFKIEKTITMVNKSGIFQSRMKHFQTSLS